MMKNRIAASLVALMAVSFLASVDAEAKGRKSSHRVSGRGKPLICRDISLQELKAVKIKIDESRGELARLHDKNGGDHGHFLDLDLIEAQKRIDALIAKKERN